MTTDQLRKRALALVLAFVGLCLAGVGCQGRTDNHRAAGLDVESSADPGFGRELVAARDLIGEAQRSGDPTRRQAAESAARELVARHPQEAEAHRTLGDFFFVTYCSAPGRHSSHAPDCPANARLAYEHYEEAIALAPAKGDAYIAAAQACAEFNPECYAEVLERGRRESPNDAELTFQLAVHYSSRGQLEQAEPLLWKTIELLRNDNGDFRVRRSKELAGRILTRRGEYARAEKLLQEAAADPGNVKTGPEAYWGCPYQALGELYTALGRPQLAVDNYIKAAEKEKDSDITQFEAAQKCFDAGRYDCALKYVDRALALSTKDSYVALREAILVLAGQAAAAPADPAARAARAKIYLDHALEFFQAQDYEKALAFADRGVALSVDGRLAIVRGFVLLLQRKYEEAERDFRDGRGQQPLGAGVGTGHLAIVRHAYREAEAQLEPGRRHDEKRNTVWKSPEERRRDFDWFLYRLACLGLAWSNANQNQHEKAIAFYNLVLSFEPADFLALLGKGNSFSGLRQLTLAEETFAGLLKAWPDNPYVLAEMALVKYNRGEDEAAERYFREALKRDDQKYTCPYEGLGLIYLRQGKLDKARQLFERAIAINPNIEYKKFNGLAKIYIKEGRFDEAEKLLRKSIENYPYDTEAKDLLQELQARRRQ